MHRYALNHGPCVRVYLPQLTILRCNSDHCNGCMCRMCSEVGRALQGRQRRAQEDWMPGRQSVPVQWSSLLPVSFSPLITCAVHTFGCLLRSVACGGGLCSYQLTFVDPMSHSILYSLAKTFVELISHPRNGLIVGGQMFSLDMRLQIKLDIFAEKLEYISAYNRRPPTFTG